MFQCIIKKNQWLDILRLLICHRNSQFDCTFDLLSFEVIQTDCMLKILTKFLFNVIYTSIFRRCYCHFDYRFCLHQFRVMHLASSLIIFSRSLAMPIKIQFKLHNNIYHSEIIRKNIYLCFNCLLFLRLSFELLITIKSSLAIEIELP